MRRSKLIALVSLLLIVPALGVPGVAAGAGLPAGGGWAWLNPTPQGNGLTDVEFVSATHGWAVGQHATLLETTDGGATWRPRDTGVPSWLALNAVDFAGAERGWAVGDQGVIARTTDGGTNWSWKIAAPSVPTAKDVLFADASNGWIAGWGVLLRTTDGGDTWMSCSLPTGDDYSQVSFDTLAMAAPGHVWASRSGGFCKLIATTDYGATWLSAERPWTFLFVDDIEFCDPAHGWMIGAPGIQHDDWVERRPQEIATTTDGGATWSVPSVVGMPLASITFAGASTGLATSGSSIVRTTNGGADWTAVATSQAPDGFTAFSFGDATHACAVGANGETARSTDGGATWQRQGADVLAHHDSLNDVCFPDPTHAWAVGGVGEYGIGDAVLFSSDGGSTWERRDAGLSMPLLDVEFVDGQRGWAAGQGVLVATTDGGMHWTPQAADADQPGGWVCFADATHGWTGSAAGLLRTTDGGANWSVRSTVSAHGFSFPDTQHGWAIGGAGIVRTTNGGATWKTVRLHRHGETLNDLWFSDTQHGWAVGYWGLSDPYFNGETLIDIVLATTDGGATWAQQDPGSAAALSSVCFADAVHGWAVGVRGTVVGTSDGGATWSLQTPDQESFAVGVPNTIGQAVSFADAGRGMAVSDHKVIGTTTGGAGPAPVTTASGSSDVAWVNDDVTVHLTAVPGSTGVPVQTTQYLVGLADGWQTGADWLVTAPADHSNDGVHKVRYRSIDTAGHSEPPRVHQVNVDTRRPSTVAPRSATARRGRIVTLKFRVWDERPSEGTVGVTIKIKNPARRVVKTLKYKNVECIQYAYHSTLKSFRVPRTWKAGTYRFYVYATDPAGNAQANVASNRLIVKQ